MPLMGRGGCQNTPRTPAHPRCPAAVPCQLETRSLRWEWGDTPQAQLLHPPSSPLPGGATGRAWGEQEPRGFSGHLGSPAPLHAPQKPSHRNWRLSRMGNPVRRSEPCRLPGACVACAPTKNLMTSTGGGHRGAQGGCACHRRELAAHEAGTWVPQHADSPIRSPTPEENSEPSQQPPRVEIRLPTTRPSCPPIII